VSVIKQLDDLIESLEDSKASGKFGAALVAPMRLRQIAESADDWDAVRAYIRANGGDNTERLLAGFAKATAQYNLQIDEQQREIDAQPQPVQYRESEPEEEPQLSTKQKVGLFAGVAALGFWLGYRK
jgi:hypothetical protein